MNVREWLIEGIETFCANVDLTLASYVFIGVVFGLLLGYVYF